jgi:hypothetical protein
MVNAPVQRMQLVGIWPGLASAAVDVLECSWMLASVVDDGLCCSSCAARQRCAGFGCSAVLTGVKGSLQPVR